MNEVFFHRLFILRVEQMGRHNTEEADFRFLVDQGQQVRKVLLPQLRAVQCHQDFGYT